MKRLISICLFFSWLTTAAQDGLEYADLQITTEEVWLSDSLQINATVFQKNPLDSITVKKWFSNLFSGTAKNRLKNRNYYLTGKITSNEYFDLLILQEEKKRSDSSSVQVVYLITCKKDGTYIASLEAAIAGIRKKYTYNTFTWLFKDNKIVLTSKMAVNGKSYDDLMNYKITNKGRFILYPKY